MVKKLLMLWILVVAHITTVLGQEAWKLAASKDGIKVYTRAVVNSKFKAIKVECSLPVHPSQLVAAIMDIDNSYQWVYHSKVNRIIKRVSPSELYYYSEVSVPWPAENRDYISHIMVSQNPKTKITTIDAPCVPGMVPEKNNIVRITHSIGKWTIWPFENNAIRVEYELEVDPSGSVPAWLINLFITQGPLETFQKLKAYLQKKDYKDVKLGFIAD